MDGKTFDPQRPHGYIYGLPGVAFEQGGRLFNHRGQLVDPVELAAARIPAMSVRQAEILSTLSRDALLAFRWLHRLPEQQATPQDLVRSCAVRGAALVRARRIFGELVQAGLAEWKADNLLRIVANPEIPDWENEG
ncbi:MAG TPA: hypothetical protein VKC56_07240 [Gallionellaceae bacterium]|nr:hypothetical protein [Gallionellaceae bacterium]